MKKSDIQQPPCYYDRYLQLMEDVELDEAFRTSLDEIAAFDWDGCQRLGLRSYAPDKWTAPDVLQHLLDWERIFTYRALRFVREPGLQAEGLDQDLLARSAAIRPRSIAQLKSDMTALRQSTRLFFTHMDGEDLLKKGICWESEMSALAIAFTILGHQRHHFGILRERYLSLV